MAQLTHKNEKKKKLVKTLSVVEVIIKPNMDSF